MNTHMHDLMSISGSASRSGSPGIHHAARRGLVGAVLCASLAGPACGDSGDVAQPDAEVTDRADVTDTDAGATDPRVDLDTGGHLAATARPPLERPELGACVLDFDCGAGSHCFTGRCVVACAADDGCPSGETCSDRGRCESSDKRLDAGDPPSGLSLALAPARDVRVGRAATVVPLEVTLGGDALPERLTYRLEDSAGLLDPTAARRAEVTDGKAVIEVPLTGRDLYALNPREDIVRVSSEAGSFAVVVQPELTADAAYAGEAVVATFGNGPLPLGFEIVTDPPESTLEDATAAWLVLPSGDGHVFSPLPSGAEEVWRAQPLVYDDLLASWIATFRHDYPLGDRSVLDAAMTAGTQRTLRFELRTEAPGVVTGRFSDRWSGRYDVRSAGGIRQPQPVLFEGTLEARHVGPPRARTALVVDISDAAAVAPRPLPAVKACTPAMFGTPSGEPTTGTGSDGTVHACGSAGLGAIADTAQFLAASTTHAQRADCAIAVAETALLGETTASMLASFFNDDGATGSGGSFDAFMQDCAAGVDGLCRPTPQVLCARELLAYAYAAPEEEVAESARLVDAYQRVTREAFLGRQLGAFQTDAETRERWLASSDFPAIVTAALRDFTASLLGDWRDNVLDVHLDVVAGQYDAAGLAMLSRQVSDPATVDARRQLVFEMSQSWRGAMEALTLATQRWNALLSDASARAATSREVAVRALDLYLLAGVASNLNTRAGAGFANASFGAGFGALARERRKLGLPFHRLIYARDAEVVVSRSLDPQSNNFNLLGALETEADTAVREAAASVGAIIREGAARELGTTQIRDDLNNEIAALRDELIRLCGAPAGCAIADVGVEPGCEIRVEAGACDFTLEPGAGGGPDAVLGPNVSDAAATVGAIQEAFNGLLIAQSELDAANQHAALAEARASAFADAIPGWNAARLASTAEVEAIIDDRSDAWTEALQALGANIAERNAERATLAADAAADAASWNAIRVGGVNTDFGQIRAAFGLNRTASVLTLGADVVNRFLNASIAGLPTVVGSVTDPSFAARGALAMKGAVFSSVTDAHAEALRVGAEELRVQREQAAALRQAELSNLRDQDLADDLTTQNELAALRDAAQVDLTAEQIAEFQVDRLIAQLRARAEAELACARDLVELRDRRDEVLDALVDLATLGL